MVSSNLFPFLFLIQIFWDFSFISLIYFFQCLQSAHYSLINAGPDSQAVFVLSSSSARWAGFVTLNASNWGHRSDNQLTWFQFCSSDVVKPLPSGTQGRINLTLGILLSCYSAQTLLRFLLQRSNKMWDIEFDFGMWINDRLNEWIKVLVCTFLCVCVYACVHVCLCVCTTLASSFAATSRFKIQDLYCYVHNNYIEAVVGNEIRKSQAPPTMLKKICVKNITQEKGEPKT